jgi:hypothetical protein
MAPILGQRGDAVKQVGLPARSVTNSRVTALHVERTDMRNVAIVFILGVSISSSLYGQQADSSAHPPALSSRLGGIWTFNKDLSTDVGALQNPDPSAGAGGRSGGGGGGGRSGGGRGGYGGYGGRGGGGGAGTAAQGPEVAQQHALMRELTNIPERVTIVVKDDYVEFTDQDGVVRKFTTNDKKQSVDLGGVKVDGQSKWDADVLTIVLSAGSAKLTETYRLTVQGHMLVEELAVHINGRAAGAGGAPIKRIFDHAEGGILSSAPLQCRG